MSKQRTSTTQLANLTAVTTAQTDKLRAIQRTAQQSMKTTNDVQNELYRQRGIIDGGIDKNALLAEEITKGKNIVDSMRRRNMCIKGTLWVLAILLFLTVVALVSWKLIKK